MWIIYSKTWGMLECDAVYSSKSFPGQVAAHGVKRNGETMREKAYFPVHDLTALIPPKGGDT